MFFCFHLSGPIGTKRAKRGFILLTLSFFMEWMTRTARTSSTPPVTTPLFGYCQLPGPRRCIVRDRRRWNTTSISFSISLLKEFPFAAGMKNHHRLDGHTDFYGAPVPVRNRFHWPTIPSDFGVFHGRMCVYICTERHKRWTHHTSSSSHTHTHVHIKEMLYQNQMAYIFTFQIQIMSWNQFKLCRL